MKKLKTIYIPLLALLLLAGSCKKNFLNETVYSSYSPATLRDPLGFEASLVGLYNHFSQFYTRDDRQGWLSVWQVGTDIAYAANPEGVERPYYDYTQLLATDAGASYTWSWSYRLINNANIIIKNIEDPSLSGMSDAAKSQVNAEARFFRALGYNTLATCFGDVPLVTSPLDAPKTDFTRTSLTEVNKQIEEDLLFAAANLPEVGGVGGANNAAGKPAGRANRYMAMQLLATAYLRMDQPAKAEEQTSAILNSGKFGLNTTRFGSTSMPGDAFSDLFVYGKMRRSQGNKEVIWVQEMEPNASVAGGTQNNPQQRRVWGTGYHNITGMRVADSLGGRGLGRLRLSNWVVYGLYEEKDMRNSSHNLRRQFWYNHPNYPNLMGKPVPYVGQDTIANIGPHTTKWYHLDPKDTFGYAMIKDIIHMRLGETYLLQAESQFKQNKPGEAAISINALRNRAGATPVTAGEITLDLILDERVRELVGEENRRMTLMRTKTLVDRAVRLNSGSPRNPLTGLSSKHLLLPIPLSEIQLNKDAVLNQNPGY
ncbi:RagB/SusD family nutrient uptake outer membrane protein [Flavisolibacter sp. BT320]|nr:RagB/SusD family nutrient uptake outer membrane protein [Flavisolibacter longurius]